MIKNDLNSNQFKSLNTAVLMLTFNRLDTTKEVFQSIRKAKIPRLYIWSDGPRSEVNQEDVKVRAFFAPNHIYDKNTFTALRSLGISQIIDGYGLFPYKENEITFIPQLFYENIFIPFGFQTTQIHLNYWNSDDFLKFENLITKNHHKITTYDEMLNNINNGLLSSISRTVSSNLLMLKRSVNSK